MSNTKAPSDTETFGAGTQPDTTTGTDTGAETETNLLFDDDAPLTPVDTDAAKHQSGQVALKEITRPVRGTMRAAQILAAISAVLAVAPYVALVKLGALLLEAWRTHTPVPADQAWFILAILINAYLARVAIYMLALALTHFADIRLSRHIQTQLLDRISRAPLAWFTATNSGKVRKAVQDDTKQLHMLVAHAPVEITSASVMPLSLLVYAFIIDWRLGLLSIATLPVYALLYWIMVRDMGPKTAEMDTKLGNVGATMVEFVTGLSVVKAFGRVGHAHARYAKAAKEFADFYVAWCKPLLTGNALALSAVSIAVLLFVNLFGGWLLVGAGFVTAVDVLATTLIALLVPYSIQVLSMGTWVYQLAGAAALRLRDTLDTPVLPEVGSPVHEVRAGAAGVSDTASGSKSGENVNQVNTTSADSRSKPQFTTPRIPSSYEVEFRGVSFSYGQVLAVDNVSLNLAPGTVTALVGPSGSGKSTLATLLARFADPDCGAITIGGVDLREIPSRQLYRLVSFVLQDPQLLRISIADNIALGCGHAGIHAGNKPVSGNFSTQELPATGQAPHESGTTDAAAATRDTAGRAPTLEDIRAAARAAQIDDYIISLPKGYDTIIGVDTNLSGGQAQRVAIARAILADTPILVMDEATAMSDPDCEAEIQAALSNLARGRTVLAIAHRPASILGAAQIAVMDQGRLAACGTHEALVAAGEPHYQKILRLAGHHPENSATGFAAVHEGLAGVDAKPHGGEPVAKSESAPKDLAASEGSPS